MKQVFAKTSYFVLIRTCARHVHMTLKQNCLPVYHHGISFSIYSIASFCLAAMAFCFVSTVCLSFKVITVIFDLFLSRIMILCPVDDRCVTCCWYSQIYELSGPRLSTVAVSKLLSDLKRLTLSCWQRQAGSRRYLTLLCSNLRCEASSNRYENYSNSVQHFEWGPDSGWSYNDNMLFNAWQ